MSTYMTVITREKTVRSPDGMIENDVEVSIPVAVEYKYYRARKGARDSLGGKRGAGPPLEPDEPESIEILGATDEDGGDIELTDKETAELEEKIMKSLGD